MSEKAKYLTWVYRRNLLMSRGYEERKGLINKIVRKMRKYEKENI